MRQSGNHIKAYIRCVVCLLTGILLITVSAFSVRMKASADAKEEQKQIPLYPYAENRIYELPLNSDFLLQQEDGTQERVLLEVTYKGSVYNGYNDTNANLVCETSEESRVIANDEGDLKAVYGICISGKILMAAVFENNSGANHTCFFYVDGEPYVILLADGAYRPDIVPTTGSDIWLHEKLLFGLEKRKTCYLRTDVTPWEVEQIVEEGVSGENRTYFLFRPLRYIPDDSIPENGFLADFTDQCQVIEEGYFNVLSYREEEGKDWYRISHNEVNGWICVEDGRLKLQNSRLIDVFTSVAGVGNIGDSPHYDLNQAYEMTYLPITPEVKEGTSVPTFAIWTIDGEARLIMAECNGRQLTFSFLGNYQEISDMLMFDMPELDTIRVNGDSQTELPMGARDVLLITLDLDRSDGRIEFAVQYTVDTEDGEQTYSRFFTSFGDRMFPLSIRNGENNLSELPVCFYGKRECIVPATYEGEFAYVYDYYLVYEPEELGGLRVVIDGEERLFGLTAAGNQITDFRKDYDYGYTSGLTTTLAEGVEETMPPTGGENWEDNSLE